MCQAFHQASAKVIFLIVYCCKEREKEKVYEKEKNDGNGSFFSINGSGVGRVR